MDPANPCDLNMVCKTQWIRLADVFLIGPLMVAGGIALARRRHPIWGGLLGFFGIATVVFNGGNYLRVRRALRLAR